jgi:hypothetical protein
VIVPAGLMLVGFVPVEMEPTSNVVMVPSAARTKPCCLMSAVKK